MSATEKNKTLQEESSSVSGYIFEEDHQGAATHKHVSYAWLMTWQPFYSASIVQAKIISLFCGVTQNELKLNPADRKHTRAVTRKTTIEKQIILLFKRGFIIQKCM